MSTLEDRIRRIEDREAMHERLLAYYVACDTCSDVDGIVDCFTEDANFDLSGLGIAAMRGHAEIRDFFTGVFRDMAHHAHFITNFRLSRQEGDEAIGHAYVIGMGKAHAGADVLVHANLELGFVRTDAGWKLASFVEGAQMPLPESIGEVHGHRQPA